MKISNIHSKHAGSTITFESILASILVTEGDAQCYHAVSVMVVHDYEGTYLELKRLAQPAPREQQVPSLSLVVFSYDLEKNIYIVQI